MADTAPQPEDTATVNEPVTESRDTADEPFFTFLDRPQERISAGITRVSTAVDEFFAEERVFYEKSGSYIRLTLDAVQEEGGETGYSGDVKIKLRLPRTQEKLKFVLESNPEQDRDGLDRTLEETPSEAAEEKNYFAGFQAVLGDERKWRFRPGLGLKLSSPLEMYARLRLDRSYRAGDWLFRPSQTFYAFSERGFRSDTVFELDHQIRPGLLFRSRSFLRYTDENDYFEGNQILSVIQAISRRRGLAYEAGVFGRSEPTWVATEYLARMRYRHNIHAGYLFLELIPRIVYRRENEFQAEHSLTLRLEIVFEG